MGLVPAIDKLAAEGIPVTLAVSLHTPDDELRDTLVPVNNRWKVAEVLDAAFRALRPGAPIVLETINAACWAAFFESYVRDFTHRWPVHPDTLAYLLRASGWRRHSRTRAV